MNNETTPIFLRKTLVKRFYDKIVDNNKSGYVKTKFLVIKSKLGLEYKDHFRSGAMFAFLFLIESLKMYEDELEKRKPLEVGKTSVILRDGVSFNISYGSSIEEFNVKVRFAAAGAPGDEFLTEKNKVFRHDRNNAISNNSFDKFTEGVTMVFREFNSIPCDQDGEIQNDANNLSDKKLTTQHHLTVALAAIAFFDMLLRYANDSIIITLGGN